MLARPSNDKRQVQQDERGISNLLGDMSILSKDDGWSVATNHLDEADGVAQDLWSDSGQVGGARQQDEEKQDAWAEGQHGLLEQEGQVETPRTTALRGRAERVVTAG